MGQIMLFALLVKGRPGYSKKLCGFHFVAFGEPKSFLQDLGFTMEKLLCQQVVRGTAES
jgi:hypothetical protein